MVRRKYFNPFWYIKLHFPYRKFIENHFQNPVNILFAKLIAIDSQNRNLVFFLNFRCCFHRIFFVGHLRIYKNQKRFSLFLKLLDSQLLRFQKILSWNFSKGTVRCNHKSNGRMLLNYFFRTNLCCLMKGNGFLKPGRLYHSLTPVFYVPCSIFYQKSHTVNQSDIHLLFSQQYRYRIFRNKFRLHCSNQFSRSA